MRLTRSAHLALLVISLVPGTAAVAATRSSVDPRVVELVRRLKAKKPEARAEAAAALGQLGEVARPAVPYLVAMLRDQNYKWEELSSTTLWTGTGSVTTTTYAKHSGADQAVISLGLIGDPRAVPALVKVLLERTRPIKFRRSVAAQALGRIGHKAAIGPLVSCLTLKEDDFLVPAAQAALGMMGEPAVASLVALLGTGGERGQKNAAGALERIGKPAAKVLSKLTRSSRLSVAVHAASVLGSIKDPEVIDPLVQMLKSREPLRRQGGAEGLQRLCGAGGAVRAPLTTRRPTRKATRRPSRNAGQATATAAEAEADAEAEARAAEQRALRSALGSKAVGPLIDALSDRNPKTRNAAYLALKALTGCDFKRQSEWKAWWRENGESLPEDPAP